MHSAAHICRIGARSRSNSQRLLAGDMNSLQGQASELITISSFQLVLCISARSRWPPDTKFWLYSPTQRAQLKRLCGVPQHKCRPREAVSFTSLPSADAYSTVSADLAAPAHPDAACEPSPAESGSCVQHSCSIPFKSASPTKDSRTIDHHDAVASAGMRASACATGSADETNTLETSMSIAERTACWRSALLYLLLWESLTFALVPWAILLTTGAAQMRTAISCCEHVWCGTCACVCCAAVLCCLNCASL